MNTRQNFDINPDFQYNNQICANYYSPSSFNAVKRISDNSSFSIIHIIKYSPMVIRFQAI